MCQENYESVESSPFFVAFDPSLLLACYSSFIEATMGFGLRKTFILFSYIVKNSGRPRIRVRPGLNPTGKKVKILKVKKNIPCHLN